MVDAKAVKETLSKKAANLRSKMSPQQAAHKHCKMCGVTIDHKADPRVCKDQVCISKQEKHGKNDKMMRIMFVVFFIAIVAPVALRLFGFGN